jgi:hypothetical protein
VGILGIVILEIIILVIIILVIGILVIIILGIGILVIIILGIGILGTGILDIIILEVGILGIGIPDIYVHKHHQFIYLTSQLQKDGIVDFLVGCILIFFLRDIKHLGREHLGMLLLKE